MLPNLLDVLCQYEVFYLRSQCIMNKEGIRKISQSSALQNHLHVICGFAETRFSNVLFDERRVVDDIF